MFRQAALKLTLLYLAVIMAISLFFSVNLYQVSIDELASGLRRPPIEQFQRWPGALAQLRDLQEQQYIIARDRIFRRLLLINLFILVGGGWLSYYLARRTLRPIQEANEAQSRFTADASHELRTPIAAMRAEIEVALMDPKLTLDDAKQRLNSNLEELERLTALSEGLLRLARMEHSELERTPVVVNELLRDAVDRVQPLADQRSIVVTHKQVTGTLTVQADQASLSEVLVILLDNAIKYSPDDSEVQVSATKQSRAVVLKVTDHGIGIAPAELPHIFERFYRADTARSNSGKKGYGIGLAIAKNIVDLHKGNVTVTSKQGKGTTFTISLPH